MTLLSTKNLATTSVPLTIQLHSLGITTLGIADLTGKTTHKVSNGITGKNILIGGCLFIHQPLALLIESFIDWLTIFSPGDSGRRTTSGGTGKGGRVSVKQYRCDRGRTCDHKDTYLTLSMCSNASTQ